MIINGLSFVALDKKFGNWSNTPLDDWNKKKNYDKNGINAVSGGGGGGGGVRYSYT